MSSYFVSLAIELGQLDLGSGGGVGDWYVKLDIELVATKVMDVPAAACPARSLGVGGRDPEPIVVVGLVHARVGDQRPVLLFQPLRPGRSVPRSRSRR